MRGTLVALAQACALCAVAAAPFGWIELTAPVPFVEARDPARLDLAGLHQPAVKPVYSQPLPHAAAPWVGEMPMPVRRPAAAVLDAADRQYLVDTARPGFTMSVLGAARSVAQLHPTFVKRAAGAIREARASGLPEAGLFSCYRPPFLGVGGFADKFNSLHAYGLAGDFTGIGSAGSHQARQWYSIAKKHGLYNPYGPSHRAEFNHYQVTMVTVVKRGTALRATITARGPASVDRMWRVGSAVIDQGQQRKARRVRVAGL